MCLSVHDGSGMFVRQDWTIVMRDLCTLIEPRTPRRMHCAGIQLGCGGGLQAGTCNRGAAAEADAIGSSSWSWSGRNQGAAADHEVDAIKEQQLEADANGEQQRSWSGRNRGAAALHRELSGAGLLTVVERGGSSFVSLATWIYISFISLIEQVCQLISVTQFNLVMCCWYHCGMNMLCVLCVCVCVGGGGGGGGGGSLY